MQLILSYPYWFLIFCVLGGMLYATGLYWRDRKISELKNWIRITTYLARFLAVAIIIFLLLEPLIKTTVNEVEKPVIVLAQDNSLSVKANMDEEAEKLYLKNFNALKSKLAEQYEVQTYLFGNNTRVGDSIDFSDKITDLNGFIEDLNVRYFNRNVGAVIMATDGIYNRGQNPIYSNKFLANVQYFPIALGDTTAKRDIAIQNLRHNRIAYKGNKFPLEVSIYANSYINKNSLLTVSKNGKLVGSERIDFKDNIQVQIKSFLLEANQTGLNKYVVNVQGFDDEYIKVNNTQVFYIDVLENKQKILIMANAPHPDIAAMKNALQSSNQYEIDIALADEVKKDINIYDFVILHNLPSTIHRNSEAVTKVLKAPISKFFIIGLGTDFYRFNSLKTGLNIGNVSASNKVNGQLNGGFTYFKTENNFQQIAVNAPPLDAPFSNGMKSDNSIQIFANQQIGATKTDYPLIALNAKPDYNNAYVVGEGLWRWRLFDYQQHESHKIFDEWMQKMAQFLITKKDKSFFRVFVDNNNITEGQDAIIDAELYNESYELYNVPDVKLKLKNNKGETFDYLFAKQNSAYRLNIQSLQAGDYTFTASVNYNGKNYSRNGEFSVSELNIEMVNVVANHQLLNQIANKSNAKVYYSTNMNELTEDIAKSGNVVNTLHSTERSIDLIHLKWIFFLIVALLSLEWFLRRYWGLY